MSSHGFIGDLLIRAGVVDAAGLALAWPALALGGGRADVCQTRAPQRPAATAPVQPQTAQGSLRAVMMPIGPSGCHGSSIRRSGRALAIVRPWS